MADKKKALINKNDEKLKYEIADELGLTDKVNSSGWKSLTAKESGKIGGIMSRMKKAEKNKSEEGVKNNSKASNDTLQ